MHQCWSLAVRLQAGWTIRHSDTSRTSLKTPALCQHEERLNSGPRPSLGTDRSATRRQAVATLFFASHISSQRVKSAIIDEDAAQKASEVAGPSVVQVVKFSRQEGSQTQQSASGIIWSQLGYIITSYSAVASATTQALRVHGLDREGQSFDADVIASSPDNDLAVLRIIAGPELLRPISVGTAASLRVGQSVYAIGCTNGTGRTLSAGVVSGLKRGVPSPAGRIIAGVIQTDAAVESGGALVDSSGRLVGMCIAPRTSTGRGTGVNFALPAELLLRAVPSLITIGSASGKGVGRRY